MSVGSDIIDSIMRYKIIIPFMALLMSILGLDTLQAQTLIILQKDGSKVYYNLDEQPITTFTTDELVITTSMASFSYPLASISRYTYEGGALGISNTEAQGISISQNGDGIFVTGLPAGKSVTVYGVDGKPLLSKRSDGSNRLSLSISKLPVGVYVIKAETVTYKITKR